MKVLFAIRDDNNIVDSIARKYQRDYNKKLLYKEVKNFTAILRELQQNNSYDRIVISDNIDEKINKSETAIIIFGISQFFIQFLIKGAFQNDRHHIPHNGIDIRSILDRYIVLFQVVAHHFPKSCFLWGILFSCHKINLQTGKSILHQFEGLHKLWDTPKKV